jgi:hypothetical protein
MLWPAVSFLLFQALGRRSACYCCPKTPSFWVTRHFFVWSITEHYFWTYNDENPLRISRFQGRDPITNLRVCEDGCLLGCSAVYSGGSLATFQRYLLPPSSGRVSLSPSPDLTTNFIDINWNAVWTSCHWMSVYIIDKCWLVDLFFKSL